MIIKRQENAMKALKTPLYPQDEPHARSEDMKKSQSRDVSTSQDKESPPLQSSVDSQKSRPKRRRKGHRKSRKGCYSCKRARMKCDENRPICAYCFHRSFRCEWPETQAQDVLRAPDIPVIGNLIHSSTPPVFTMLDFRLFNHFTQIAYPKHPLDNDSIWTHEIPCISTEYDYLLHSILALSASDLAITEPSSYELKIAGLAYRIKAIASLSTAVSFGIQSFEEGNAMLATCYNLFAQSVLFEDGFTEYMVFLRGIILIAVQMVEQSRKIFFHSLWAVDDSLSTLHVNLNDAPLINPNQAVAACLSLEKFQHLCVKQAEVQMYKLLLNMARALFTSSRDAFLMLRKAYGRFAFTMDQVEFCHFTDSTNEVGRLLQSHLVALQLIMAPISNIALRKTAYEGRLDEMSEARWLGSLSRNIPNKMLEFYQWPLAVEMDAHHRLMA